jgi:hypothetical protein
MCYKIGLFYLLLTDNLHYLLSSVFAGAGNMAGFEQYLKVLSGFAAGISSWASGK